MVEIDTDGTFTIGVQILEDAWRKKKAKEIEKVKEMVPLICDEAYAQGFEWYGTLQKREWVQYQNGRSTHLWP